MTSNDLRVKRLVAEGDKNKAQIAGRATMVLG
jgi:hypothetical protein